MFFSCVKINETNLIFSPDSVTELLLSESYNLSKAQIMNPQSIKFNSDKIMVLDDVPDKIIKQINNRGDLIQSFGRRGNGPEEFNQVTSFFVRDSNSIDLYDQGRNRLVQSSNFENVKGLWVCDKSLDLVTPISDSLYVCAAVFDSASTYLMDKKGLIIDQSFYFPPKKECVPLLSHSMAMSGVLVGSISSSYFAKASAFDGGIDVFQIERNKIIHKWRFSNFDMEYDIIQEYNNVPAPNDNTRRGYIDIFIGRDKIYALFSGKRFLDSYSSAGNLIHVFDFNGNHNELLVLEKEASMFTIDEENLILYAFRKQIDDQEMIYLDKYSI